jgi:hypothetical protein
LGDWVINGFFSRTPDSPPSLQRWHYLAGGGLVHRERDAVFFLGGPRNARSGDDQWFLFSFFLETDQTRHILPPPRLGTRLYCSFLA